MRILGASLIPPLAGLIAVLLIVVPSYAVTSASPLASVPDDIYIHFFGGAAVAGLMDKHQVNQAQAWVLLIAGSLAKEAVDSSVYGSKFDLAEVTATLTGALFYYRF